MNDPQSDWEAIARDLTKFSRDSFNAETLITEAENSRYRQAMIDRLANALKSPAEDQSFLSWLASEVYQGKKTKSVMERLGKVACEAINPALGRVMSAEFIEKLREGIEKTWNQDQIRTSPNEPLPTEVESLDNSTDPESQNSIRKREVITTEEEMEFYELIKDICMEEGVGLENIIFKDTQNYFNVSFLKPTKWFVRLFGDSKRKFLTTLVPKNEANDLCSGFEIEDAPSNTGVSRIYIKDLSNTKSLKPVIIRSLEILHDGKTLY